MFTERCLYSENVSIKSKHYEIVCIPEHDGWHDKGTYSLYIQPLPREFQLRYMYGAIDEGQSIEQVFEQAKAYARQYMYIFEEDWH